MACALAVSAVAVLLTGCGDDSGSAAGADVLDARYTTFESEAASLADHRGKPLVVNFFSSTCEPCLTEMPEFQEVHEELGDEVVFLGLNVADSVPAGLALVDATGITWELGRDPRGEVLSELGGIGLPTTVVADADGRVVFLNTGQVSKGELEAAIDDAQA
jgi:thiol-disulfide isomerase/thioredoxin